MALTTLTRRAEAQTQTEHGHSVRQHGGDRMHWLIPLIVGIAILAVLCIAYLVFWTDVSAWARAQQRIVQNELARSLTAMRGGDVWAVWGLIGLCATYGIVHALGPGHGKILISGAAAASRRTAFRMGLIGFAASLMQAVSAIVLVYGGMGLLAVSSGWAIGTTERILAPASYGAMAIIGLWLCWRGTCLAYTMSGQATVYRPSHDHSDHHHVHVPGHHHEKVHHHDHHDHSAHEHHAHHADGADCGCKHMPTADDAERAEGWRDIAAMILSIGIRPCSGALIVLVIAWHFGMYITGALSAIAMAVGTGCVVAGVAVFATHLRQFTAREQHADERGLMVFAGLQIMAGLLVAGASIALMITSLQAPITSGLFG
ncbi:MAG: hypothetical protein AAFR75_08690 [Pseudomonadota bacterium]